MLDFYWSLFVYSCIVIGESHSRFFSCTHTYSLVNSVVIFCIPSFAPQDNEVNVAIVLCQGLLFRELDSSDRTNVFVIIITEDTRMKNV